MAFIRTRIPWGQRPSHVTTLNRTSPLAQGLVGWWPLGGDTFDRVNAHHFTKPANTAWTGVDFGGMALTTLSDAANGGVAAAGGAELTALITPGQSWTIGAWAKPGAYASNNALWAFSGTDDVIFYSHDDLSGNGPRLYWRDRGGTIIDNNSTTQSDWAHYCVVVTPSLVTVYVNGISVGTSASADTSVGTVDDFALFGRTEDTSQAFYGSATDLTVHSRALSQDDVRYLVNPRTRWDLYEPMSRRTMNVAAGGGSTFTPQVIMVL